MIRIRLSTSLVDLDDDLPLLRLHFDDSPRTYQTLVGWHGGDLDLYLYLDLYC